MAAQARVGGDSCGKGGCLAGDLRYGRRQAELAEPYVSALADVVVAADEAIAREHAGGYGLWVRSIGTGEVAIEYPAPAQAYHWTAYDKALIADRLDTQFVGSPGQAADDLERLRDATGADELIVTKITHDLKGPRPVL